MSEIFQLITEMSLQCSTFPFLWGWAAHILPLLFTPPDKHFSLLHLTAVITNMPSTRTKGKQQMLGRKRSWAAFTVNQPPFFQITLANGGSTFRYIHLQRLISLLNNFKKNRGEAGKEKGKLHKENFNSFLPLTALCIINFFLFLAFSLGVEHQPKKFPRRQKMYAIVCTPHTDASEAWHKPWFQRENVEPQKRLDTQ